MKIKLLKVYQLHLLNQVAKTKRMHEPIGRELSPVSCYLLLELFPFGVVMTQEMRIEGAGEKLLQAWGGKSSEILNRKMSDIFKLRRPKGISFTWRNVSKRYRFYRNKR